MAVFALTSSTTWTTGVGVAVGVGVGLGDALAVAANAGAGADPDAPAGSAEPMISSRTAPTAVAVPRGREVSAGTNPRRPKTTV
ncbi:hypothetical protein CMMCAS08_09720 [Clavibacter michiganensis subsp. michiganensis]|nr:hypothetical protein DOU02_09285 [Clavibacter michiganensis subsp. michiganensis]OUE07038.1 hypothetical protein CMMCAS08_09720 [Clavibacter michiganensis subsp. michiganensis]